jgi:EmrB/QacA subfamily drug resistance transporter
VPEGRPRALLAIIFSATVVIALNATMISVALPRIVSDLGASATAGNWMLLAYMLVNGSVLVLTGQVADSFDLRGVFLTGMAVFTVTSLVLAGASSPGVFIALRAVQGLGAAMLLSTAAAMIAVGLPPERMARSMGIYLAGFATAQVAGPAVGGLITSVWDWRGIFLINVPIGLGAFVVGWSVLRTVSDRRRGRASRTRTGPAVDPLGNLLILVATSAALIAVSSAQRTGWGSTVVMGGVVVVLVAAVAFVAVERRARNPAIDVELLGDRRFAMANLAGLLLVVPRMAPTILLSLWFQGMHGDPPITAALKVTPIAVGVALGSLAADRRAARKDEARVAFEWALVTAGALVVALGVVQQGGAPWLLLPTMAVVGYATGVFSTANATMIMRSAPAVRAGSLNGIRTMSQTVGLSLGTALVLTLVLQSLTDGGAASFLAGESAALGVGDRAALHDGYVLAFAALTAAAVVGALLSRLALPRRVG